MSFSAYRGTISLPFNMGEYGRIVFETMDDRGIIESLKIMGVT